MEFIYLIICSLGLIMLLLVIFKPKKVKTSHASDKNKSINDLSFQRYAKFYGSFAQYDVDFVQKVDKIYNLIENEKCEDIELIAKESNCTIQECIIKINYLQNKRVLEDYYVDKINMVIKKCSYEDKELLNKYTKFIYYNHMQIDEIAVAFPNTAQYNLEETKKKVKEELKYLIDKSLLNGVTLNEIDGKLVYYTIEKHKKEKNIISIDCPKCGALNEVNRGSKVRCEYCNAIIEAPLEKNVIESK